MQDSVKTGTAVVYRGSIEEFHGVEFVVLDWVPASKRHLDVYPGGVAYVLEERHAAVPMRLHNVRRTSFDVVE